MTLIVADTWSAAQFARRRGLTVWDTCRLLEDAYTMSDVGCPEAYDVLVLMRQRSRPVRVPAHHSGVC